ncbi:MAG TPA: protein kinase, partial [Thermoanaerobaculia bacterium]
MTALPPGSRLGRFEIAAVLGEGAMGTVYLAHDPHIERPVALKTLRADAAGGVHGEEVKSRFLKEAKLAGRLAHPNVVTIYETGGDQGLTYIAMEYVDGESLTQWLVRRSDAPYAERIEIVRQVAQALEHAHARGVLHRDIKPGNILLAREGRVKVADFGIGKLLSGTGDLTRTGQMIGSPAYMSPEQIRGEKLDPRSDLFSLGVVLYELLTGRRPFPGDSITTLVYQILHTEPKDPLTLRADLPPSTSDVIVRLLAKSPDRRPSDAAAFLKEISRIEGELTAIDHSAAITEVRPVLAAEPTVRTEPPPPARVEPAAARQSGPAYVLAAAALLAAVAIFAWVWKSVTSRTVLPAAPRATSESVAAAPAPRTEVPIPTPASLPTRGPEEAADAIVGATRIVSPGLPLSRRGAPPAASKRLGSAPEAAGKPEPPVPPAPPPAVEAPSDALSPDNV